MTKRATWATLSEDERRAVLQRPALTDSAPTREAVQGIVNEVRAKGDAALRELTRRYDQVELSALSPTAEELAAAQRAVTPERRRALEQAQANITRFHAAQARPAQVIETLPGVRCQRVTRPIERVGLYVPGGSAPLVSTVLMLGVPSRLAGCTRRVLCTPPRQDGSLDAHLLVAAHMVGLGAGDVFKVGGAQAIAAMAYGTASVPKVDKICGPGNAWVTAAKMLVSQDPAGAAIDLPAGPTEAMVVADASASPELVAADLLSQAEHGADAHVLLVATDGGLIDRVEAAVARRLADLPRREIAAQSLAHAAFILARDVGEAYDVANAYAPEHLLLHLAAPDVARVRHAGSVFVGPWSPESVGDYASGTNHVLPTYGAARVMGGVSLDTFVKLMTVQELTPAGLAALGPVVETLADLEGLQGHRQAVSARLALLAESPPPPEDDVAAVLHLARTAVQSLTPYASARSLVQQGDVLLDANENPYPPLGDATWNRYPAPQPPALLGRLAELYDVPPSWLVAARGTDDLIDALIRTFCEAREDGVVVCPPTYGVYGMYAALQGARVREALLDRDTFAVDVRRVLDDFDARDKLLFVCSPNNPTGNLVPQDTIAALCEALRGRALVVLDEAYIEFAGAPSGVRLLPRFANLVVLRTLSKAHALAGARCGVAVARPPVIDLINKVRAPYPLAGPAVDAVLAVLAAHRSLESVARIRDERVRLAERLSRLACVETVFASDANFLLVRTRDAAAVMRACRTAGVVIRDRSREPLLAECVRISVGTPEQNNRLLAALGEAA